MERGDFLSISPTELKFPFELKKQSSCILQLKNETNHYIAFKVKTTNPKKYCARPNTGIILPGIPCDVTVIMQAQKEAPPVMQCKDKFLVQSSVASTGATIKDITSEMFNKEPGKVVKEFKLRATYVPAYPPHQSLGSEEGSSPRASLSDNGYLNASLLEAGQQSSDEELDDVTDDNVYDTKDSSIDDGEAELDSLRPALGHEMPSSSKPEQTRSKNVPNGGSGLTLDFPDDSNSRSTIINGGKVIINYYLSTMDLVTLLR